MKFKEIESTLALLDEGMNQQAALLEMDVAIEQIGAQIAALQSKQRDLKRTREHESARLRVQAQNILHAHKLQIKAGQRNAIRASSTDSFSLMVFNSLLPVFRAAKEKMISRKEVARNRMAGVTRNNDDSIKSHEKTI
jgi:hypothetical protein